MPPPLKISLFGKGLTATLYYAHAHCVHAYKWAAMLIVKATFVDLCRRHPQLATLKFHCTLKINLATVRFWGYYNIYRNIQPTFVCREMIVLAHLQPLYPMFTSRLQTFSILHHWPVEDSIHSHASLVHALIICTCRLKPGREYKPNELYVLNSRVRLITRVYGSYWPWV